LKQAFATSNPWQSAASAPASYDLGVRNGVATIHLLKESGERYNAEPDHMAERNDYDVATFSHVSAV
jgi:hypothetical protein